MYYFFHLLPQLAHILLEFIDMCGKLHLFVFLFCFCNELVYVLIRYAISLFNYFLILCCHWLCDSSYEILGSWYNLILQFSCFLDDSLGSFNGIIQDFFLFLGSLFLKFFHVIDKNLSWIVLRHWFVVDPILPLLYMFNILSMSKFCPSRATIWYIASSTLLYMSLCIQDSYHA